MTSEQPGGYYFMVNQGLLEKKKRIMHLFRWDYYWFLINFLPSSKPNMLHFILQFHAYLLHKVKNYNLFQDEKDFFSFFSTPEVI